MLRALQYITAVLLFPASLSAQSLEQRITAVGDGTVRLSFPVRSGVCGSSGSLNIQHDTDEWEYDCGPQQARVALRVENHRVVSVRTYVGGRWREETSARDLATVRPQEAAAYFLDLAEHSKEMTGDPVLPAALADSVTVWPALLRLARRATLPELRRTAVFWVGQAAEAAAGLALDSVAKDRSSDREVRKQAVFALSQRSQNEAVPALIRIARSNPDPEIRKAALFWLGQSEDPRAIDLFEEILR
jgi:hypothetical protein